MNFNEYEIWILDFFKSESKHGYYSLTAGLLNHHWCKQFPQEEIEKLHSALTRIYDLKLIQVKDETILILTDDGKKVIGVNS